MRPLARPRLTYLCKLFERTSGIPSVPFLFLVRRANGVTEHVTAATRRRTWGARSSGGAQRGYISRNFDNWPMILFYPERERRKQTKYAKDGKGMTSRTGDHKRMTSETASWITKRGDRTTLLTPDLADDKTPLAPRSTDPQDHERAKE